MRLAFYIVIGKTTRYTGLFDATALGARALGAKALAGNLFLLNASRSLTGHM